MMTVYCPKCYAWNPETAPVCESCGASLEATDSGSYTDGLIWALKHPEPTVAPRAAWVLGERRDHAAVGALIEAAESSRDMGLLEEVALALGKLGQREAIPALARLLAASYLSVRVRAARALGMIGDRSSVSALESARTDPSSSVRSAAEAAIESISAGTRATR